MQPTIVEIPQWMVPVVVTISSVMVAYLIGGVWWAASIAANVKRMTKDISELAADIKEINISEREIKAIYDRLNTHADQIGKLYNLVGMRQHVEQT